jgi:hypothetical protein
MLRHGKERQVQAGIYTLRLDENDKTPRLLEIVGFQGA